MQPLRLAFAGTAPFAVAILDRLLGSGHAVEAVYTQPDRRAGRGRKRKPSPVRSFAEGAGLPVRTPTRLDAEAAELAAYDAFVVAAYGLLLPESVLEAPRHGCINVHASLLPRWRGAAPVERAIMAGDPETGVTIMRVDAGLDTGPVYCARPLALNERKTGAEVTAALALLGAEALLDTLARIGTLAPQPQDDGKATYAPKLEPADAVIEWQRDAATIDRQVRALSGRMPAFTTTEDNVRVRILGAQPTRTVAAPPGTLVRDGADWAIACGVGGLSLRTVQLNRGKGTPLSIRAAVNGYPRVFRDGARFLAPRAP